MESMQGGVFSPSGDLLYLTSGFWDGHRINDGINVLETRDWTRLRRSSNGGMPFEYRFKAGYPYSNEPEGITIWDLDDGKAPGIGGGQLHVLMLDNDLEEFGDDDGVYLRHYTESIYVNAAYSGN
jgi:hypothetical protein